MRENKCNWFNLNSLMEKGLSNVEIFAGSILVHDMLNKVANRGISRMLTQK